MAGSGISPALEMGVPRGLAFEEARCQGCGRLLLRWHVSGSSHLEVKCPRCQMLNLFTLDDGSPQMPPTKC
jgi:phage FluMu protein Com